ncbi:MAG: 2-C-methyl-D-erythritol 2,4-cyclodiphosphate synthase [Actinobacteria bacterium]|nr:2-C-methyl-D-erythritol 2,4-cyclodiphosphate synthase [Actinomycetota bacterium]
MTMRIGQGFDIHRFSNDATRPLKLGLVTVPNAAGLEGHSDADAVAHAVADALLGAAGLGDIGEHFSDTDATWSGADSRMLLTLVVQKVRDAGFVIENVDVTVIAEAPKLGDLKAAMVRELTVVIGAPVSVKATTMERLGPIGNKEGIAALAVALLKEQA